MSRIVIIGNAGGGKSTLARKLARHRELPLVEIDRLVWRRRWELAPEAEYEAEHARLIAGETWIIDGLGHNMASISARIARATEIILIDMPLWMHCWLIAERQIAWALGRLDDPPAGIAEMPTTEEMFRSFWDVERDWMPEVRTLCRDAERRGTPLLRIDSVEALDAYAARL